MSESPKANEINKVVRLFDSPLSNKYREAKDGERLDEYFECEHCKKMFREKNLVSNFPQFVEYRDEIICASCFKQKVLKEGTDQDIFILSDVVGAFFSKKELYANGYEFNTRWEINKKNDKETFCDACAELGDKYKVIVRYMGFSKAMKKWKAEIWLK